MPGRALIDRRPWLLASLVLAIAYFVLRNAAFPGVFLMIIEVASLGFLAAYARLRHSGRDATMLSIAMLLGGIGVVVDELEIFIGTVILIGGIALLIGIFFRHRREVLSTSQRLTAVTLLLLPPLIAWFMALGHGGRATAATYVLAAGGMASAAWASAFPRYRVGVGAVLYLSSGLLGIAAMGRLAESVPGSAMVWPIFYLGHFLMCTGIIQTLRSEAGS